MRHNSVATAGSARILAACDSPRLLSQSGVDGSLPRFQLELSPSTCGQSRRRLQRPDRGCRRRQYRAEILFLDSALGIL